MDGGKNDLTISEVPVQRERRNRTDDVTCDKVSNVFAHRINNTGGLISQAGGEFHRFDILVTAPHRVGAVDADGFDLDTNFTRFGSGNWHLDEFQDVWPSGFRKLDDARHGNLRGWCDIEYTQQLWRAWQELARLRLRQRVGNFHQLLSEVFAGKET